MSRPSIRLLITLALVMAISGAAGAFAAGGRFKADVTDEDPTTCVVTDETSCEEPADGDDNDGDRGRREEVTPEEREAECAEAAGLEVDGEEPATDEVEEPLTGLDRAIERVYANCLKNPDAPGLVNALAHLRENAERKAAHDAAREAAAAERAAEKAEREAERLARAAERAAEKAARAAEKAERGNGGGNGNGNGNGGGNPHD